MKRNTDFPIEKIPNVLKILMSLDVCIPWSAKFNVLELLF